MKILYIDFKALLICQKKDQKDTKNFDKNIETIE